MNTYTEVGRSFKTFLKENYAIALDSCYLFTKKMLNMKLNMILIVLMETLDIREIYSRFDEYLAVESDDEFDSLLVFRYLSMRRQISYKP